MIQNVPLTEINNYITENKHLINQIKGNITNIGDFMVELNNNFNSYVNSLKFTGAIDSKEKKIIETYNLKQERIKGCIEDKNKAMGEVSLKIDHKKDTCKWMSKAVTKQLQQDFLEMSQLGELMIKTISSETESCLKNYAKDEKKCLKCLSENRKPMIDQVSIFLNRLIKLIDDKIPELEHSIGIVTICVSEAKQYIKRSEKLITHNLEDCFLGNK